MLYVIQQGADQLNWAFLTDPIPIDRAFGPGMGPAVAGTLLITGAAALMAIPIGVLGGIYLNEYGGRSIFARVIRFLSEVMTGVPSVVMGLFIYTFVVLETQEPNAFAGALALACLMLPIVIRTTDQMLMLVPARAPRGQLRARLAQGADDPHGRAPERGAGHHQRRAARGRPCRRRDRPAHLHDRDRQRDQLEPLQRARTPRCRRRSTATPSRRSPGPRNARGARHSR